MKCKHPVYKNVLSLFLPGTQSVFLLLFLSLMEGFESWGWYEYEFQTYNYKFPETLPLYINKHIEKAV